MRPKAPRSSAKDGTPLIHKEVYAAMVLMVMVSTVVTPPWLASRLRKVMANADPGPQGAAAAQNSGE
ncbi:MAG: hypothetical protein R3A47_11200 [Polyangiales bacterium]